MTASESEDSSVGCTPSESDCSDIEEENVTTTSERPSTVESTTKEEEESAIAARETRLICASKVLVAFVLLLSATCAGIFTFRFTSSQEEEVFRRKVRSDGVVSDQTQGYVHCFIVLDLLLSTLRRSSQTTQKSLSVYLSKRFLMHLPTW